MFGYGIDAAIILQYFGRFAALSEKSMHLVCRIKLQQQVETVYTSREVRAYVSNIAAASRKNGALQLGVSTRAAISLLRAAQARSLMLGRDYVSPDDVQSMAESVLAHRLVLSPEARMRNMTAERVLSNVIGSVQVPVKAR